MITDIPELDVESAYKAYDVFRKLTRTPANRNTARQFYKFLGAKEPHKEGDTFQKQWDQVVFTEQARVRVDWLLGPHAEIMYKIWEAQNHEP